MYAKVLVNRPTYLRPPAISEPLRGDPSLHQTFTYRLPERLRDLATIGHLVQVPLGASTALGVIVGLSDLAPTDLPVESIRDVIEILDPLPVVTALQIQLARWIADEYLVPLRQAMRLMLPPGLEGRTVILVTQTVAEVPDGLTGDQRAVLRILQSEGGRLRLSTLLGRLRVEDPEAVIHTLADKGVVDARYSLVPPKPAPPRVRFVRLLADDPTIDAAVPRLGRASKQADVLLTLASRTGAPLTRTELCELAGCTPGPIRALARRGWVQVTDRRMLVMAQPGAASAAHAGLERAPKQADALSDLVERGAPVELSALLNSVGVSRATLYALEKRGLVRTVTEEPLVLLTLGREKVIDCVVELRGSERERAVLDALRGSKGRMWVGGLYAQTGADLATLKRLAVRGLVSLHAEEYDRPRPIGPEEPHRLTRDQESVWREVQQGVMVQGGAEAPFVALLHGVTGSGKTEIYLRALDRVLEAGRRGIVLVPEISLTTQTVRRFEARFPGRVAVMHSQLTLGQRYAVWDQVRRGQAEILIGPRSALLAPVSRLGLIVVDEAHDGSYKQGEPIPLPPYHARDVAVALGHLADAPVLFGTATPDLVTYHRAQGGSYRLLELPHRVPARASSDTGQMAVEGGPATRPLPPVRVVDLRQELQAGNRSIFSRPLQESLRRTLQSGEQAILFLNRRGAATFILCRQCGHVLLCPRCDVPLTLHCLSPAGEAGHLVCHRCNHKASVPSGCPSCGGPHIRYFGLGTERVESVMRQLYPQARLLRWDRDTATGADHERFLQTFIDHRADVLIGTQMIAKGLDLPRVTLVGVVSADTALFLPDYRAAERTFQILTQVAGRAGRSHRGGQVIVQTYNPDHYAIRAAAQHDYSDFYRRELALRRQLGYPPFSRLVALRYFDRDPNHCRRAAEHLHRWLKGEIRRLRLQAELIGPAPCFFERTQGRYRWQIVVRAGDPMPLLREVTFPRGWHVDVDPVALL